MKMKIGSLKVDVEVDVNLENVEFHAKVDIFQ